MHLVDTAAHPGIDPPGAGAAGRSLTLCIPTHAAVVLGSAQSDADIDMSAAGVRGLDVARRRSGGGAVFVDPVDSIWVEAWIPRTDPLWVEDVSSSMLWLGRAFVAALAEANPDRALELIVGPYEAGRWGRRICFLSEAPGEVRGAAGKVVGISQRRDRRGARLQAILYRRWDPARWQVFGDPGLAQALLDMRIECIDIEPALLMDRLAAHLTGVH